MSLNEANAFSALKLKLAYVQADLKRTKAQVKAASCVGYNRALRQLARKPTRSLLLAVYRQGRKAHG